MKSEPLPWWLEEESEKLLRLPQLYSRLVEEWSSGALVTVRYVSSLDELLQLSLSLRRSVDNNTSFTSSIVSMTPLRLDIVLIRCRLGLLPPLETTASLLTSFLFFDREL